MVTCFRITNAVLKFERNRWCTAHLSEKVTWNRSSIISNFCYIPPRRRSRVNAMPNHLRIKLPAPLKRGQEYSVYYYPKWSFVVSFFSSFWAQISISISSSFLIFLFSYSFVYLWCTMWVSDDSTLARLDFYTAAYTSWWWGCNKTKKKFL